MSEERIETTKSGMIFYDLLILLRELTRSQLGMIQNPNTGEYPKDIQSARHLVDMIAVLQEKTEGNLTDQEATVLENLLTELRVACVRVEDGLGESKKETDPAE
ncbi:DUF1844 domain-containing protein [bacterium]|nr:DUF1844 domain-containing protein [bacterium]